MTLTDAEKSRRKRRLAQALFLWQGVALIGILTVSLFAIWHLKRRSRVIREKFHPKRFPEEAIFDSEPIRPDEPKDTPE